MAKYDWLCQMRFLFESDVRSSNKKVQKKLDKNLQKAHLSVTFVLI